ncbi:MAG: hypothetical protein E7353_00160 [Clostridiales bacterium]|nr:hypothetical protein [Clostridiales bacterium]
MRRKTKGILTTLVVSACVGVAGFALAGGFSPKEETRDMTKTDSSYTQNVDGVSYSMSSNIEGVTFELPDPLVVNGTYYFTLEAPAEVPTIEGSTVEFTFSHFEYNYGTAELMSEDPLTFRLTVAEKDVSKLKVKAIFEAEEKINTGNNSAEV